MCEPFRKELGKLEKEKKYMDRINEQQANLFHSIQSSQGKEEKAGC